MYNIGHRGVAAEHLTKRDGSILTRLNVLFLFNRSNNKLKPDVEIDHSTRNVFKIENELS